MKAYVIVTLNLCAMNGANMYIYNKTQFLEKQGYRPFVFSAEQGDVVIPGLRKYQKYQLPALRLYPACFSRKTVNRVLDFIKKELDAAGCDEALVESSNLISALWGELIAESIGCKHLAFILTERFGLTTRPQSMKDFLRFKLDRHELAGISKTSVCKMLCDDNLPFDESMHIHAYCNNSIDDCEDAITPQLNPSADLTFGSIGRLDKPYVLPLAQSLKEYFCTHSDKSFNLVMVGGTRSQKSEDQIRIMFTPCKNVTLVLTGVLFPIPKSLVASCDLFISAAGSATATYYQGRPTIKLNPENGDVIGIPGLTYSLGECDLFTSNAASSELKNYIDLALLKKSEIKYTNSMENGKYIERMREEFDRQLHLVDLCDNCAYYDVSRIKYERRDYRMFNVLGKIISPNTLYKLLELARKKLK